MSGLAQYWQSYFPSNGNNEVSYGTSISEIEQSDTVIDEEQYDNTVPMDYMAWKKFHNAEISKYLTPRLLTNVEDVHDRDDDNDDGHNDGSESDDRDTVDTERSSESSSSCSVDSNANANMNRGDYFLDTQQEEEIASNTLNSVVDDKAQSKKARVVSKKRRRISIPHISEARNEANLISEIDLKTRLIHLDLCYVDKIWKFREIKRPALLNALPKSHVVLGNQKTFLKTTPFSNASEDGPLSTIYRDVISFDIIQLQDHSVVATVNPALRAAAAATAAASNPRIVDDDDNGTKNNNSIIAMKPRRMRVFLYNRYASKMNDILADYSRMENEQRRSRPRRGGGGEGDHGNSLSSRLHSNNNRRMIISLGNVPAQCVMPFAVQGWFDREEMVDYCLCIGDESTMKELDRNTMKMRRFRFDLPERMHIRVGVVNNHNFGENNRKDCTEWTLANHRNGDCEDYHTLNELYGQWKTSLAHGINETSNPNITGATTINDNETGAGTREQHLDSDNSNIIGDDDDCPSFGLRQNIAVSHDNMYDKKATSDIVHEKEENIVTENISTQSVNDENSEKKQSSSAVTGGNRGQMNSSDDVGSDRRKTDQQAEQIIEDSTCDSACKRQKTASTVHYLKLRDLRSSYEAHSINMDPTFHCSGPLEANIYALVLGFSSPCQTRRGDWMMTISLVDETLDITTTSAATAELSLNLVTLVIFCKEKEMLPKLTMAGDVIRLHRVVIQCYQGEMQLLGKRSSSYLVYRGKIERSTSADDWHYHTPSHSFVNTEENESKCTSLWKWGQSRLCDHPTIKCQQTFRICDVKRQTYGQRDDNGQEHHLNDSLTGDFTVMIAAIIPVPPGQRNPASPRGFLRVWDGTGIPVSDPIPLDTPEAHEAVKNGDPPAQALVKISSAISRFKYNQTPAEPAMEAPKALCGRVVNATIWEDSHWDLISATLKVGSFIRLRNVSDSRMPSSRLRCLMVFEKSWLTPLPDMTYEISTLLADHNQRIRRNEPVNLDSGLLPLTETESGTTVVTREDCSTANISNAMHEEHSRACALNSPSEVEIPAKAIGEEHILETMPNAAIDDHDIADKTNTNSEEYPTTSATNTIVKDHAPLDTTISVDISSSNLTEFLTKPANSTFSGIIYLVKIFPDICSSSCTSLEKLCTLDESGNRSYKFGIRIQDCSLCEIDVLVSNQIGERILGIPATEACFDSNTDNEVVKNLKLNVSNRIQWKVEIRSVLYQQQIYFVVCSISKML